ncbi:MAG: hypothetical protein ACRCWQ_01040 [Bacilli bacterium]
MSLIPPIQYDQHQFYLNQSLHRQPQQPIQTMSIQKSSIENKLRNNEERQQQSSKKKKNKAKQTPNNKSSSGKGTRFDCSI